MKFSSKSIFALVIFTMICFSAGAVQAKQPITFPAEKPVSTLKIITSRHRPDTLSFFLPLAQAGKAQLSIYNELGALVFTAEKISQIFHLISGH